ncbi:CocE/NonD family hydrolase [Dyadobacter fermentans]|uniref:X-Pro dipeptidyl-peptidase domain protein n=1 Tax=Dyadobacter fermentans (strain ATCC 700827 / DSM 18053 / CIP 107007 / KCTC 52180 / NS114) TaxID=471854 RepID=C6W0R6_DYAFD|nr:CocE/NonD family hydrolase [Dyadobacter fermentans]ACT93672.1 X-Pro dipeptidyl-peptidase domain protein [Dyadobacter fermentans DSM 18053]
MMLKSLRASMLAVLAMLSSVHALLADTVLNEVRIERHKAVRMRDGVVLYADVYMPATPGRYPTIVTRTPYGVQRDGVHQTMIKFAQRGYAVVVQDVRGRYESDGKWEPFRDEAKDGYDTIEWAAAQPFSNGKVATQGGSYLGHNQWQAASLNPPHLVAAFPSLASTNIYANWITMGGAFRLSFNYGWGVVRMPNRIMLPQYWHTEAFTPEELKYANILMHLPLQDGDLQSAGAVVPHYRDWIKHESYDEYWKAISDEERFDKIKVPTYVSGGWFDIFVMGTINGYVGMKNKGATPEARKGARMIIGPWGHGPSQKFGDVDFTAAAYVDQFETELSFFDYHLKGIRNAIETDKPVRLFYMGVNQWRAETDWPIPGTQFKELYLGGENANSVRGKGTLSFDKPTKATTDTYRYDPQSPVPTTGGNNCCGTPTPAGPRDQRPLEQREDVLVYTSAFLEKPVTIAGPVKMKLHAATDGRDTDWMVKLVDVHPDGFAMPVSEGIIRAKFRKGLDKMKLLTPNQVYEYEIEMTGTANVFRPGHRIRVDITSSNFPQFDRNPNTGEPLGTSTKTRIAQQTVHHGGAKLSHIVLPVVTDLSQN